MLISSIPQDASHDPLFRNAPNNKFIESDVCKPREKYIFYLMII